MKSSICLKMYIIVILVAFSIIRSTADSNIMMQSTTNRSWCWTKPSLSDTTFILNTNNGGVNWGYCTTKAIVNDKKKEYRVKIDTSSLPDSQTS